jgi:hypothetical protein
MRCHRGGEERRKQGRIPLQLRPKAEFGLQLGLKDPNLMVDVRGRLVRCAGEEGLYNIGKDGGRAVVQKVQHPRQEGNEGWESHIEIGKAEPTQAWAERDEKLLVDVPQCTGLGDRGDEMLTDETTMRGVEASAEAIDTRGQGNARMWIQRQATGRAEGRHGGSSNSRHRAEITGRQFKDPKEELFEVVAVGDGAERLKHSPHHPSHIVRSRCGRKRHCSKCRVGTKQ